MIFNNEKNINEIFEEYFSKEYEYNENVFSKILDQKIDNKNLSEKFIENLIDFTKKYCINEEIKENILNKLKIQKNIEKNHESLKKTA